MTTIVYDIQLVLELEDDQTEPTLREVEVALEQSTAGEALTLALDDRKARLRLPLPRWVETEEAAEELTVSKAQDQILGTAFDLNRIARRLQHQYKGLAAQYESVRTYWEGDEPYRECPSLEVAVADNIDQAADQLQDIADDLLKASRLTDALVRQKWHATQE